MKIRLWAMLLILLLATFVFSQEKIDVKEQAKNGVQIIENARKAIGAIDIVKSVYLSTISESVIEKFHITESREISLILPDKILLINSSKTPVESKDTTKWNGEKYKKFYEFVDLDGRRTITDATKSKNYDNSIKFALDKGDKETAEKLEALKKNQPDPTRQLYNNLWTSLFPLILTQPFESNAEFKYIGNVKASNTLTTVVDVVTGNSHLLRLFFDSKTNYLLLMIETYTFWDGDYENKYYYSNRELINNVLIPRKIKVENKFTPTGKEPRISYVNIDILEFKLNPEFKKDTFEIK